MSDRVKITYSIEMDELEEETLRLWNKGVAQLEALLQDIQNRNLSANILSINALNDVQRVRQTLSTADIALDDLSSIIHGYIQYQAGTSPPAETPSMDELEKKIEEFKEQTNQ